MSIAIPQPIADKLKELEQLVEAHPLKIPTQKVAKFLGMDYPCLMRAIDQCKVPFAIGCDNGKYGNRYTYIPTATFYFWYAAPLIRTSGVV